MESTNQESTTRSAKCKVEDEQSLLEKKEKTLEEQKNLESEPGPSQPLQHVKLTVSLIIFRYQTLADNIVS